jgi:hypothetical protein
MIKPRPRPRPHQDPDPDQTPDQETGNAIAFVPFDIPFVNPILFSANHIILNFMT